MSMHSLDYEKLIKGRYESERVPKDFSREQSVPDFAFNVLNPLGLLYRPVSDENFLEKGGKMPSWPDGKAFVVCLTHDVDVVSGFSLRQSVRGRRAQFYDKNPSLNQIKAFLGFGMDLTRSASRFGKQDPLHCFQRWLEVEKAVGGHSTFFFWPGLSAVTRRHHSDCMYELYDSVVFDNQKCTIAEMIREIDRRGGDIGLHPSWYSFDDIEELKRQKESLEKVLGHEVVSIRQHYLHYNIRITPTVHAKAGFMYDSSLGFNYNIGFRFGTCYPWYLYDLNCEKELSIMEIPLIVQDNALLSPVRGMSLSEDLAFQYVVHMATQVEKVGGVLTILWHPNHIVEQDFWNLYISALRYLKQKDPWFASLREVGEWCEKMNCIKSY